VRLRSISICVKKYQQAFLVPLSRNGCRIFLNLVLPHIYIFSFYKKHKKYFYHDINSYPLPVLFKGVFVEPLSKPKFSSGYELRPSLIALVQAQPFSRLENENPCHHMHEFAEMCSCLSISGMTQETLRWKLFPFSLIEKVEQWYTHAVGSMNGD
jgi:hypothetical protein